MSRRSGKCDLCGAWGDDLRPIKGSGGWYSCGWHPDAVHEAPCPCDDCESGRRDPAHDVDNGEPLDTGGAS